LGLVVLGTGFTSPLVRRSNASRHIGMGEMDRHRCTPQQRCGADHHEERFQDGFGIVVLHWIRMEQLAICQLVAGRFDGTVGQRVVARKRGMVMANHFENIRAATGDV